MEEQILNVHDRAHNIVQEMRSVITSRNRDVFRLGKLLGEIRDEDLFSALGYDTFPAFLADPDISFQKTSAYNFIELYQCFIVEHEIEFQNIGNIPYSKLLKIKKYVTPENIDLLVGMAREMGGSDLDEEMEALGLKKDKDGAPVEIKTKGEKLFERYKRLPAADRADFNKEFLRYNKIEQISSNR